MVNHRIRGKTYVTDTLRYTQEALVGTTDTLRHTQEAPVGTCTEFSERKVRETLLPLGRVKRIIILLPSYSAPGSSSRLAAAFSLSAAM
jgi:hypothetical protein